MMTVSLSDFSSNIDFYAKTAFHTQITVEKDGEPYFKIVPFNSQTRVSKDKTKMSEQEARAFFEQFSGSISREINYKAEREAWRDEKYESST